MNPFNWANYWQSKNIIKNISRNYWFSELFDREYSIHKLKNSLEIGGFPGYYSIWLKKYLNVNPTLLDKYIDPEIISKLCLSNNVPPSAIGYIQKDIFRFQSKKKYDLVFSIGLIEHFNDPSNIIKHHWRLVNRGGALLMAIPNFLGLNGISQLIHDPENLQKHNLSLMQRTVMRKYLTNCCGAKPDTFYYGGFNIWFEHPNLIQKSITAFSFLIGVIFRFFGLDSKLTSPYLVAIVYKP